MTLIIMIVAMVVVFVLLWVGIGYVPNPAAFPYLTTLLRVLLCIVAAYVVYIKFIG